MKGLSSLASSIDAASCNLPPDKRAMYYFQVLLNAIHQHEHGMITDEEKASIINTEFKKLLHMDRHDIQKFRDELLMQNYYFLLYSFYIERIGHLEALLNISEITEDVIQLFSYESPELAERLRAAYTPDIRDGVKQYRQEREFLINHDSWKEIEERTGYQKPSFQAAGVQA